jgi:prepilin-type N-terminal cleavage/methylation domain-containing protein
MNPKNKGFTLIELLIVVAIIGLLTSIVSVALNTSRMRARDARRVSDMKQIKAGLDLYFQSGSGYPTEATWAANVGKMLQCGTDNTLVVPHDPLPTYSYTYAGVAPTYSGCGDIVTTGYTVQFFVENKNVYYTVDQAGTVRDAGGNAVSFDSLL